MLLLFRWHVIVTQKMNKIFENARLPTARDTIYSNIMCSGHIGMDIIIHIEMVAFMHI